MTMAIPPQFLKADAAKSAAPDAVLTPAHKKKARAKAIAAVTDDPATDTSAPTKGSQPPWLAKGK